MTDPWNPAGQQPQGYGPPQPQQWGQPPYGYYAQGDGPPGRVRANGTVLLLAIVTLGIYVYVYNYKVHDEMKTHSGRGIGGGIALLLTFLAGVAMPFVTPSEVGNLYVRKGQRPPVNGWTGLWAVVPAVGGYVLFFVLVIAASAATSSYGESSDSVGIAAAVAGLLWFGSALAGGIVWLWKTNGSLNRYWERLAR